MGAMRRVMKRNRSFYPLHAFSAYLLVLSNNCSPECSSDLKLWWRNTVSPFRSCVHII